MIVFDDVRKSYAQGRREVHALRGVSLEIESGEFVAVMGRSGSGKSTLLHLAGALDLPSSGRVTVAGATTSELSDAERTLLRRRRLGFVFQFFNLIPTLTVAENVALPRLLDGARPAETRDRAAALLERVGLRDRTDHIPEELSGGEMQRVAIARALMSDPEVLLADEPTGNLDSATGSEIMALIRSVADEPGKTVVMVTHDAAMAKQAGRLVVIRDGLVDEGADAPGIAPPEEPPLPVADEAAGAGAAKP